jgi:hypothetical protein
MKPCTGGNRRHDEIIYTGHTCPLCASLEREANLRAEAQRLGDENGELCDTLFAYQQAGRDHAAAAK